MGNGGGGFGRNAAREWRTPNRSFTLVEMLVVVAIIAILAGLLLPSMQKALGSSYQLSCQSNMRQIGLGWQGWAGDHYNLLVPAATGVSNNSYNRRGITSPTVHDLVPSNSSTNGASWVVQAKEYLGLQTFGNTSHTSTLYWTLATADRKGVFACPASPRSILYVMESQTGLANYNIGGENAYGYTSATTLGDFYSPSRKVILADTQNGGYTGSPGACAFYQNNSTYIAFARHIDQVNCVMADGSSRPWSEAQYTVETASNWWKTDAWGWGHQKGGAN